MDNFTNSLLWTGVYFAFISLFIYAVLWFVKRFDASYNLSHTRWMNYFILGSACLTAALTAFGLPGWNLWQRAAASVLSAYLIAAAVMDIQTQEVYDFLPYLGAAPGILYLLCFPTKPSSWIALVAYCLLQLLFFSRMYGMADAKAFCVSGIYISVGGGGFLVYLYHMSASFILLGVIQAFRHNISRKGNLKNPVPFLPYILAGIWPILLFLPYF
jgi:hypothetical protein